MESEDIDSQIYSRLQRSTTLTPADQVKASVSVLTRLLQNISSNPEESKYRSIKKSNKAIQAKLLSVAGMPEILNLIGFVPQDSDTLTIHDISNVETSLIMLQVFDSELAENLKTEEQKENERRLEEIRKKKIEQDEKKKMLLQQAKLDRQETNTKLMPTQDSVAVNRGPTQAKTFKDIGVDLNTQKKG